MDLRVVDILVVIVILDMYEAGNGREIRVHKVNR